MKYWLVKSDPDTYGWSDLVRDGRTVWDGVRNHQAKSNLAHMSVGDEVLFYHSQTEKAVVGTATVASQPYPEPKHEEWVAIDLVPGEPFVKAVTLAQIKADPALSAVPLIRQSRLSVMPLTRAQAERLQKLSHG